MISHHTGYKQVFDLFISSSITPFKKNCSSSCIWILFFLCFLFLLVIAIGYGFGGSGGWIVRLIRSILFNLMLMNIFPFFYIAKLSSNDLHDYSMRASHICLRLIHFLQFDFSLNTSKIEHNINFSTLPSNYSSKYIKRTH